MNKILPALLLTLSFPALASDNLLTEFVKCDSSFFHYIFNNRLFYKKTEEITPGENKTAWFGHGDNLNSNYEFNTPLKIGQLTAVKYTTQFADFGELGKYYFWGLEFIDSRKDVMKELSSLSWRHTDDDYFANTLIRKAGQKKWELNRTAVSGVAPAKGSTEKLVDLSQGNDGKTLLLCSLQGSVKQELLFDIRPDLKGK